MTLPVKPINEIEEKAEVWLNDKILILDADSEEARLASKDELKGDKWDKWDTWETWPQWATWPQWEQGEQGEQWEQWPQWATWPQWPTGATGNWISTITETTAWKEHTITITETNWNTTEFTVLDGADWQGAWDVVWPNWAVDGHVALFNGNTGKIIKDGGALPNVINSLTSTSTTDSLSAAQGKALNDKIEDLSWLGKFLSLWNASTGLPISFPLDIPYTYTTWDYFLVEVVSSATPAVNYKPNGSSYAGTASSTTESDELEVWDVYIYDWTTWLLQSNHGKTVAFANIAGQPSDNTALDNALDAKQDVLTAGTGIDITSNTISTTSNFGTSNTSDSVVQKEVSIPWIKALNIGQVIHVLPSISSIVGNSTIKLNNFDAYPMRYNGSAITTITDNIVWQKDVVSSFLFDWTYWQFIGHGLELNTTYSSMSASEATTGTSTSARTISASVLKWAVQTHAPVKSVNWQTWAVTVSEFSPSNSGSTDQVLTKTASWYQWATPSWWDVMVSTQANNILTSWMKIWAGTQANYEWLSSYDNNTIYLTIE